MKKLLLVLALCLALAPAAQAAVVFQNLSTAGPPSVAGQYHMLPFNVALQAAVPDFTVSATIPGSPVPGTLTVSPSATKKTVPSSWASWSHGYTGPIFETGAAAATLTLPPNVGAFYFYAEPNQFNLFTIQATTDTGATSGPIAVNGNAGANGFEFYTTAGETIATITITTSATDFAIGEFGAAAPLVFAPIPTLSLAATAALAIALALLGVAFLKGRSV